MFTTPSGQTGKDAYKFELAAITNEHRELCRRMTQLMVHMMAELPRNATYEMSISSDRFPNASVTADYDTIIRQLNMSGYADEVSLDFIRDMLKTLTY